MRAAQWFLCSAVIAPLLSLSAGAAGEIRLTVFPGAPLNSGLSSAISYSNPGVKTFVEQWLLTAYLSDGALLTVLFLVHNAGLVNGNAGVLVRYLPPAQAPIVELIASKEPKSRSNPFDLLFDPSFLSFADGSYQISARGSNIGFTGRLEPLAAPYTAGDGRISDTASKKYMSWEVMVPRGRVRGELIIGKTGQQIEGYANLEHAEATLLASDISRAWRTVRIQTDAWTLHFLAIDFLPALGRAPFVLVHLTDAGGSLLFSSDCTLSGEWRRFEPSPENPPAAQWGFSCRFTRGRLDARIVPVSVVERSRLFDGLPLLLRLAARLLSREPYGYLIYHSNTVSLSMATTTFEMSGPGYDEFLEFAP
jgi:hypothetical protein